LCRLIVVLGFFRFSQDDVKVTFAPSTAYQAALAYLMGQVDFPFTEDALPVEQLGAFVYACCFYFFFNFIYI
jgi:hypothetical protein